MPQVRGIRSPGFWRRVAVPRARISRILRPFGVRSMKTRRWMASPMTSSTQRGAERFLETSPRIRERPWRGGVRMNCGNAAGMSGIPCIEEIEGSLVSDLSDVDARRAESERLLEAFGSWSLQWSYERRPRSWQSTGFHGCLR